MSSEWALTRTYRSAGGDVRWDRMGSGPALVLLSADTLDALIAPWLGEVGQSAFYRQIAQTDQRDTDEIQPRYGELDLPVLVVWGRQDGWIPVAKAHELRAAIPGAELALLDDAGHLVQEDAPEPLLARLTAFLQAHA